MRCCSVQSLWGWQTWLNKHFCLLCSASFWKGWLLSYHAPKKTSLYSVYRYDLRLISACFFVEIGIFVYWFGHWNKWNTTHIQMQNMCLFIINMLLSNFNFDYTSVKKTTIPRIWNPQQQYFSSVYGLILMGSNIWNKILSYQFQTYVTYHAGWHWCERSYPQCELLSQAAWWPVLFSTVSAGKSLPQQSCPCEDCHCTGQCLFLLSLLLLFIC